MRDCPVLCTVLRRGSLFFWAFGAESESISGSSPLKLDPQLAYEQRPVSTVYNGYVLKDLTLITYLVPRRILGWVRPVD
jgi:hypothetical protein